LDIALPTTTETNTNDIVAYIERSVSYGELRNQRDNLLTILEDVVEAFGRHRSGYTPDKQQALDKAFAVTSKWK
jgi:hypothetical protein